MLTLRIIRPGRDDQIVTVPGREALIGRGSECDVVIDDRHVSKRHARILIGMVVVDQASTNGTFVDGARVQDATVIEGGVLHLGDEEEDVRIELVDDASEDLSATVARKLFVPEQPGGPPAKASPAHQRQIGQLRRERDDLVARVEALSKNLESRELAALKVTQDQLRLDALLAEQKKLNGVLRERTTELEARVAETRALRKRVEELEARRAESGSGESDSGAGTARTPVASLVSSLVRLDFGDRAANVDWDVDTFLTYEMFRFLKTGDRALEVTDGTRLRELLETVLAQPEAVTSRRELLDYLRRLHTKLGVGTDLP